MKSLRQDGGGSSGGQLVGGTQLEVRLRCASSASSGAVGVDVLATADGAQRTRVSYNFTRKMLVVDQRASCGPAHSASSSGGGGGGGGSSGGGGGIVQTAPLTLAYDEPVELAVFLDGYMLEVFANNRTVQTTQRKEKTLFYRPPYTIKLEDLPRQARDSHEERR
eukprot:COSAG06_NODE_3695_length_4999_cov_8.221837_6_plen_165_part_00